MIKSWFLGFASKGAGAVMVALGSYAAFQTFQAWRFEKQRDKARVERDVALEDVKQRDTTIQTLAKQKTRTDRLQKDSDNAEKIINSVEDSTYCVNSPSVSLSLEWLRERDARKDNSDALDTVRLSGGSDSP